MNGLNIGRLIRVSVDLTQQGAANRGFGTLLIVGDSDVITPGERIRSYVDLDSVALEFGVSAPEYFAAQSYYTQSPKPLNLQIGRWVRTDSSAILKGGILSTTEKLISNWDTISDGSFSISVDGVNVDVTGADFTAETNLNGVASVITSILTVATCLWDGSRFTITSNSTGVTSTLSFATTEGTGTDISTQLKLTASTALAPEDGVAAETPVEAVLILSEVSALWYGCMFGSSVLPTDPQYLDVSELIEGLSVKRILGITSSDTLILDALSTSDIASELKALARKRTFVHFSENINASASFMGRAFSVNFNANRSTITMMYKQEPGFVPTILTETQAQTLKTKRCNVFAQYSNDTAIIQYGVMSGDEYFDERHGLDWFENALQTAVYNLLYTTSTKIPQTDAGQNQLVTTCASVCEEGINNGLFAAGTWNATGFGQLQQGQYLPNGYYIYTQPIALQSQIEREQRIAPPIQIACKLAGAIQEVDIIVSVNR